MTDRVTASLNIVSSVLKYYNPSDLSPDLHTHHKPVPYSPGAAMDIVIMLFFQYNCLPCTLKNGTAKENPRF